jgi:hypothetical protein
MKILICSNHHCNFIRRGKMSFQAVSGGFQALSFISTAKHNYSAIELAAPRQSKPCELYEVS